VAEELNLINFQWLKGLNLPLPRLVIRLLFHVSNLIKALILSAVISVLRCIQSQVKCLLGFEFSSRLTYRLVNLYIGLCE